MSDGRKLRDNGTRREIKWEWEDERGRRHDGGGGNKRMVWMR